MSENIEIGYVISGAIEGTTLLIKGSAMAVREVLKILQWIAKKVQSGKLKPKEYKNFQKFIKKTNGRIHYLNVPAESKELQKNIREIMKKMNIPHYIMPDLNPGDGMIQIAYPESYEKMVTAWFDGYCRNRLEMGDFKDPRTLTALSGGEVNTALLTVPTEDEKLLGQMAADFHAMDVHSFVLLPDVNKGDGTREVLYVKKDEEKIKRWLDNFCQKHVVQGGERTYRELQNMAGNKGQVGFINIPSGKPEILEKMKEDFQKTGINYHVITDMRTGQDLLQIMYLKKDEVAVRNWYSNYATDRLTQGGEHTYTDIINLTNGRTQISSIPVLNEDLENMKADFDSLHINYSLLPQLKVNDKGTVLLYASADAERVRAWYTLYQEKILSERGENLPDMKDMDMEGYTQSAKMNAEDYIRTQEAGQEEEVIQKGETAKNPEKMISEENVTKKNSSVKENPDYQRLDADPSYYKITINRGLVASDKKEGIFISRIPGMLDRYMSCDSRNVFKTDFTEEGSGETYIAFIPKNHRIVTYDKDGNLKEGMSAKELLEHYSPVDREFGEIKNLSKNMHQEAPAREPKNKAGKNPGIKR